MGKEVGLAPQIGPSDSISKVKLCFLKVPQLFKIPSTAGNQVFKHVSQWGNLSHLNHDIPGYLRLSLNLHSSHLSTLSVPSEIFKDLFLLFLNYKFGDVMCTWILVLVEGGQRYQIACIVNHVTWVLRTELKSSGRAVWTQRLVIIEAPSNLLMCVYSCL